MSWYATGSAGITLLHGNSFPVSCISWKGCSSTAFFRTEMTSLGPCFLCDKIWRLVFIAWHLIICIFFPGSKCVGFHCLASRLQCIRILVFARRFAFCQGLFFHILLFDAIFVQRKMQCIYCNRFLPPLVAILPTEGNSLFSASESLRRYFRS